MQKSIHNLLAAGLLSVGALSAVSSTSSAQSLDLYIGPDGRPELRDRSGPSILRGRVRAARL